MPPRSPRPGLLSSISKLRATVKKHKPNSPAWTEAKRATHATTEAALRRKLAKKEEKLAKVMEKIDASLKDSGGSAMMHECVGAFVTFEHEESANRCLEDYRGYHRLGPIGKRCQPPQLLMRALDAEGNERFDAKTNKPLLSPLRVERAAEPSNILWEVRQLFLDRGWGGAYVLTSPALMDEP